MGDGSMAYNADIDARIRKIVSTWEHTDDRKMFGGVCHLMRGNMFCGVHGDFLILRLGEENAVNASGYAFVKPFDITGRPMKGWVMVGMEGFPGDEELKGWLELARDFVKTLPPK